MIETVAEEKQSHAVSFACISFVFSPVDNKKKLFQIVSRSAKENTTEYRLIEGFVDFDQIEVTSRVDLI